MFGRANVDGGSITEMTDMPREVIERAMAHPPLSSTSCKQNYNQARGSMARGCRPIMDDNYCQLY